MFVLNFLADHQKLEREARICRLLKHPNIGEVYLDVKSQTITRAQITCNRKYCYTVVVTPALFTFLRLRYSKLLFEVRKQIWPFLTKTGPLRPHPATFSLFSKTFKKIRNFTSENNPVSHSTVRHFMKQMDELIQVIVKPIKLLSQAAPATIKPFRTIFNQGIKIFERKHIN